MNARTTYILMALVGLLLAGLGIYIATSDDEKPNTTGILLNGFAEAGVKDSEITSVEIATKAGTTVYSKDNAGRWRCLSPLKVRVDSGGIEAIIHDLLSAKIVDKGVDISSDPAKHELSPPQVKITLKKGVDREATVSIGTVTIGQDRAVAYVISSDEPGKVRAVRRGNLQALFKVKQQAGSDTAEMILGLPELRERRLLGSGIQDVLTQTNAISIKQGTQILSLGHAPNGPWVFTAPANYGDAETEIPPVTPNPEAIYAVRQLISQAIDLQVRDPKDFIDNPKDLAPYGLDAGNPDLLRIDIERAGATQKDPPYHETLLIGKKVADPTAKDAAIPPEMVYAMFEKDSAVAKIDGTGVKFIRNTLANPKTMRSKDLIRVDVNKVDAMDIANASGKIELRRGGKDSLWYLFDGDASQPANFLFVKNLIDRLNEKSLIQEYPPPNYTADMMGITAQSPKLSLWEGGIVADKDAKEPAKKPKLKDKPTVELIFGKKNVNTMYVRRIANGQEADFEIPLNVMDQMVSRPRVEYIEVRLKTFNPDTAKKVSVRVGTEMLMIDKEADKWKIASPEKMKGRFADPEKVVALLRDLANLRPLKTIADKADESKLTQLKLDDKTSRMFIKVELSDEKDKERIYYFGNDSEANTGQYLKMTDQPYIVEATKAIYLGNNILSEFLDRQVYKIAPETVKGLKITGWTKQTGDKPVVREFENKDGKWIKKSVLNYDIEPTAINNFLLDVTNVKAEEMLGVKEAKPDYNLDLAKDALEIVLQIEGGKTITLMLGGEDPKSNLIYAKSSEAGGEIFTLLKDRYKGLRDTLTVFKKLPINP